MMEGRTGQSKWGRGRNQKVNRNIMRNGYKLRTEDRRKRIKTKNEQRKKEKIKEMSN
jgi:hypothetical protein